jgi:3-oxoacyl-[acyl-carrier-protein] synthase II
MASRRAVLTGIGVVSPLGVGPQEFWASLRAGQSGVRRIQSFNPDGLPVRFAGEVPDFQPFKHVDRKKHGRGFKMMARTIQLGVVASQLALDDAGVDIEKLDPARFGLEFGAGLVATELEEMGPASQASVNCQPKTIDMEKWGSQGIPNMPPLWMLKYLPNMIACHVSIMFNAQGPSNTITESDVASLLALGEAYRILTRNQADFFLVGGGESKINPLAMARQMLFQPLSRRNEEPTRACRPFDRGRDGMIFGEGAGVFVLEELEHARRRGAHIYAEVVGFGAAFDRKRDGAGRARAARAALKDAGIKPEDIDHVNAHGISVIDADVAEARGMVEVFGANNANVPLFAAKSYMGNLGAAADATEMVASLLALKHGVLPPTLNYEQPDPACPVAVVAGSPRPIRKPYFLKMGCTDLGQCAAVVCKKWDQ